MKNTYVAEISQKAFPFFKENCDAFFHKEMAPIQYKGISGSFGSYAERGGERAMVRLRFLSGKLAKEQILYVASAIRKYAIEKIHLTTGQSIQFHHLSGKSILSIFQESPAHGVYCLGSGGDHFSSITASPLRGVDKNEYLDISPYVDLAQQYQYDHFFELDLPRKFKIAFTNGADNESHATLRDLGFTANRDGTFDVYAAGGLGPNPQRGIRVGTHIDGDDCLRYLDAMLALYSRYGERKIHSRARSRYLPASLGQDKFIALFQTFLALSQKKTFPHAEKAVPLAKEGADGQAPKNRRIKAQKQKGLYYINYKPLCGEPQRETLLSLCDYLAAIQDAEIRINSDQSLYIVNLTAAEAKHVAALTAADNANDDFESSVSCIGAAICQMGIRDSQTLLHTLITTLRDRKIDTKFLPKMHLSGCHFSCGTQQIGAIGLRGAVKRIDDSPQPAFAVLVNGSYEQGEERFSQEIGIMTEKNLPLFLEALACLLNKENKPFAAWYADHETAFADLVMTFA
ncbi:nitrite/sulfite reductase [Megasphaera vaginalis (ex Srinivasan et al. 2021)]|uniref:Nitrite/sulfite reductase, 4Fe-4S iron-sulfur cluster-binding domain protein n=1 Tax=Megasphaera vaginalis (ex Srinivasan et al. 2021) TaxID=1111454 RepID=U7UJH3_9FIRM|nr:nitrite/sulfite reductase [Megasphaera vaginalis (ex Srinivasan et al. 2021)]ERT58613.1 nitrite/sulfite reductase, 4Fe-4S iron-sulfur cluster-binding domain protein [Megasphaera vaginalis (ex Srinivasan et al. 2021)]